MRIKDAEDYGNERLRVVNFGSWQLVTIGEKTMKIAQKVLGTPKGHSLVGVTIHEKKIIAIRRAYVLQTDRRRVLKTINHEIAHVICGKNAGHNKRFRIVSKALGGYVGPSMKF